jgi:putative nucleotidyltransferase with HDIG domain
MSNGSLPARILVVEDDDAMREVFISMLASAGYDCREATSAREALTLLESGEEVDLILSNFMMPGLNGYELLKLVKPAYPDIPFILATGVRDTSSRVVAMRDGAYDYLLKPFDRDQLLATVHRALEYRRLKLENHAYQANLEKLVAARTEQLRQAVTALEGSYDISLEFIGDAMDLRDGESGGHSKRVTAFAIAIARAMGVSTDQIRIIARGAFLHDIGKLAIPADIVFNPGPLTVAEMAAMYQHCVKGYEITRKVPFLAEAAEIVYFHHERFNGTGYPRGLVGDQIPLGARIVAIANTLDAITSNLPYRPAQSFAAAREEIQRCSGTQFDPAIVETFLAVSENIWSDLRKEIDQ